MKKIGILGGTFDPIHIAHLVLAQSALEQFALEEVWLMPSKQPPHKSDHEITSAQTRLMMVQAAVSEQELFVCSDFELQREGCTYTYKTLELLNELNPDVQFYFIVGADSLYDFEKWRNPERIAANAVILAANRGKSPDARLAGQITLLRDKLHADIRLLSVPPLQISSSGLRQMVREGRSIRYLTPEPVRRMIMERRLYRS